MNIKMIIPVSPLSSSLIFQKRKVIHIEEKEPRRRKGM